MRDACPGDGYPAAPGAVRRVTASDVGRTIRKGEFSFAPANSREVLTRPAR